MPDLSDSYSKDYNCPACDGAVIVKDGGEESAPVLVCPDYECELGAFIPLTVKDNAKEMREECARVGMAAYNLLSGLESFTREFMEPEKPQSGWSRKYGKKS